MATLYIIGNGFDIAHGLATRYGDFHDWLRNVNHRGAQEFSDSINGLTDVDLWSSFEEALGKIMLDEYIDYLKKEYGDTQKIDDWTGQADAAYAGLTYEITPKYKDLLVAFQEWAISLRGEGDGASPIYKGLTSPKNYFINFNYTDTLELVYGIKGEQILYIHGDSSGETEIIVGHDHDYKQDRSYIDEQLEGTFPADDGSIRDKIIEVLNMSQKNTSEVIRNNRNFFNQLKNIKRIVVIGHSYGSVDEPYFAEIKRACPFAIWELGWYKCEDYYKAQALKNKYELCAWIIPTEAYKDTCLKRLFKMIMGKYTKYEAECKKKSQ